MRITVVGFYGTAWGCGAKYPKFHRTSTIESVRQYDDTGFYAAL